MAIMTTVQTDGTRPRSVPVWKWLGLAFLAAPVLVVAMFAVAEGIGGEEGWWGHLIQLAIGLALVTGAWFLPKVFGPLLIVLGIVPVVAMLVSGVEVGKVSSSTMVVWLPLLLSGVFFSLAGYRHRPTDRPPEGQGAQGS
jgi:hypothetical protein